MSESLHDILLRRDDTEPPEIAAIKAFIMHRFNSEASVAIKKNRIVVGVRSAALAGSLRMHMYELQKLVKQGVKISIQII
jgi:hypothetical protein